MDFAILIYHRLKVKKNKNLDEYSDLVGEFKIMEHEGVSDASNSWRPWINKNK